MLPTLAEPYTPNYCSI